MTIRRSFSREFNLEAVRKVTQQGLSVASVAREMDVRTSMSRKWQKDFQDQQLRAARPDLCQREVRLFGLVARDRFSCRKKVKLVVGCRG